jgi:hypothetical protein
MSARGVVVGLARRRELALVDAEADEQGMRSLASGYAYEPLPLLTDYELGGRGRARSAAALSELLAVTDMSQRSAAAALAEHLAEHQWSTPAEDEAPTDAAAEDQTQ